MGQRHKPHAMSFLLLKLCTIGCVALAVSSLSYLPPGQMKDIFEEESKTKSLRNIMVEVPHEEFGTVVDFLGPDVDAGFRVAKFSDKKKLVVSANLSMCLISFCTGNSIDTSNLNIVSLEVLRGVWGGRPYPVVWYFEDWGSISNTFYYDEVSGPAEGSEIIRRVAEKDYRDITGIRKIYDDLNLNKEISDIESTIKNGSGKLFRPNPDETINRSKMAEVHCAAICFNKDGKVLIAKRHTNKKRLKGVWMRAIASRSRFSRMYSREL